MASTLILSFVIPCHSLSLFYFNNGHGHSLNFDGLSGADTCIENYHLCLYMFYKRSSIAFIQLVRTKCLFLLRRCQIIFKCVSHLKSACGSHPTLLPHPLPLLHFLLHHNHNLPSHPPSRPLFQLILLHVLFLLTDSFIFTSATFSSSSSCFSSSTASSPTS